MGIYRLLRAHMLRVFSSDLGTKTNFPEEWYLSWDPKRCWGYSGNWEKAKGWPLFWPFWIGVIGCTNTERTQYGRELKWVSWDEVQSMQGREQWQGWARKISRARIWSCARSFPNLLVFWKVRHAGSLASWLPGKFSDWGHKSAEQKRSQDGFPSLSLKRLHLLHDSSFHQTLLIHGPSSCQTSSCRSYIFF